MHAGPFGDDHALRGAPPIRFRGAGFSATARLRARLLRSAPDANPTQGLVIEREHPLSCSQGNDTLPTCTSNGGYTPSGIPASGGACATQNATVASCLSVNSTTSPEDLPARDECPAAETSDSAFEPCSISTIAVVLGDAGRRQPPPKPVAIAIDYEGTVVYSSDQWGLGGHYWNKLYEGTKKVWADRVQPEWQSFVHGSDVNGHVVGDIIAGVVVYGDVRDSRRHHSSEGDANQRC